MTQQPPQFGERASYGEHDVCYRHSDRPSFTLCQRCGRTVCPECQNQSSVGLLCPDCVKEMQPSRRQRGARAARAGVRRASDRETPVVTYTIMIVCVVVWVAQYFTQGIVAQALWYAPVYSLPEQFQPWRMVTAMFTHSPSSFFHILFNMYALWLFGRNLEQMLGRSMYTGLYLLAGLGGSLAVQLWGYTSIDALRTPTVGASGAIFGILAATLVVYRRLSINITTLAVLIVINFAIGFLPGAAISWQAHLGGMIVGAITVALLMSKRGTRKRNGRVTILITVAIVLIALSFIYFLVSPLQLLTS